MFAPPSILLDYLILLLSLEKELCPPIDEHPEDLYRFYPIADVVVPPPWAPSWLWLFADLLLEVPACLL